MHISEGVLSAPVLVSGGALAAAGTAIGLKKIDYDHIARVGILSATFFVASLVHVPIGPSSVHLIMNGIVGLLLGWAAFPAILVALVLQAVLFQFGGITALNCVSLSFSGNELVGLIGPEESVSSPSESCSSATSSKPSASRSPIASPFVTELPSCWPLSLKMGSSALATVGVSHSQSTARIRPTRPLRGIRPVLLGKVLAGPARTESRRRQ